MTDKERIMNTMVGESFLSICPHCESIVYARRRRNPYAMGDSNMRWCPKCLKGEAGCFWRIK